MKKHVIGFMLIVAFGILGCEEETTRYIEIDNPPAVPRGIYSITGDGEVEVFWIPVQDEDLMFYRVWRSLDDSVYHVVGTTYVAYYRDLNVTNGVTYYYAVSAVDSAYQESELSWVELVFDTPRPEGENVFVFDYLYDPDRAGFDFETHRVVRFDATIADIFVDYDVSLGAFFINAANELTDLQDMGYTYDFDEIGYAPDEGWSAVGWVEAIEGHTYVIWTDDDHFAKMRIIYVSGTTGLAFDWAYQEAPGNLELARPQHDENYLGRTKDMIWLK